MRHRLERYRAGHCLDDDHAADPDALADAVRGAMRTPVRSLPVETDGARNVARVLADLP